MKKFSINQDILKIAALVLMTIDHIGKFFPDWPLALVCRIIGRASYPIFAYLLMKNLFEYQIFGKYLRRLGIYGIMTFLICVPIQMVLKKEVALPLNILISFWIAVAALYIFHEIEKTKKPIFYQWLMFLPIFFIAGACSVLSSYGFEGFCFSVCLYFYFSKRTYDWLFLSLLFSCLINITFCAPIISLFTIAFLLLCAHIEPKPRLLHHWWLFYVYYPAHFVVLALIAYFL